MTRLLVRFVTFRNELATLWRAFMAPETPWHLKALMLLVPAYLLSYTGQEARAGEVEAFADFVLRANSDARKAV